VNIPFTIGKKQVRLITDENNYIIEVQQTKKDGTPGEWRGKSYLSTPEAAFNRLLEMNMRNSDAVTLMELRDDIVRFRAELTEVWGTTFQK
jgi:hypothetical protein